MSKTFALFNNIERKIHFCLTVNVSDEDPIQEVRNVNHLQLPPPIVSQQQQHES